MPSCTFAQDSTPDATTNSTANATVVEVKLGPSDEALTVHIFPNSTNDKFFVGKPISIVVGFSNIGSSPFNISYVQASLMYPQDHRYYIHNYTKTYYGEEVSGSELRSFLYTFAPDPMLEPRSYGLVISVYYNDLEGSNYTHVVFNRTIELIETDESMDVQTLFLYVGVLGVAGLVGFIVYKAARSNKRQRGPKRVEYGTNTTVLDNEWLEGTAAARTMKNTAVRSPKATVVRSPKTKKN